MGLVEDRQIIWQGLEVYHGCRLASALKQGKSLNGIKWDFSVAK
jgi:hypothetical protein